MSNLFTPPPTQGHPYHHVPPPPPTPILTGDQFQALLDTLRGQHSTIKEMDPLTLARLEHFLCQGLSSKFDGSPEKLPTWLLKFKDLREQHPWRSAIYFTPAPNAESLDLLTDFLKVKEPDIRAQAKLRWQTVAKQESYKANTPEFYARILGRVIVNSISDDFHTTLQTRAGPHVSNDGPLLLWLLLNHFHSSTITYAAQLSETIRNRSLQEHHNHDVESYIIWLQQHLNTLQSIDPTSLADKATTEAIFRQLLSTTCPALQRIVEEWYIEYHSETLPLDPIVLSDKTSKRIHILKTVGKLNDTATNPEIMALKARIDAYANTAASALNAISRKLTTTKPPPNFRYHSSCCLP
jgi:hypothetical protein